MRFRVTQMDQNFRRENSRRRFEPLLLRWHFHFIYSGLNMTKQAKAPLTQQQLNDRANALNKNAGTSGTNPVNAHVHGNRGKQLNPNQR